MLYDNHGRPITYLRLAVTDRCNLRCFYCMPAEGINYLPRKELLTYEEMERLIRIMVGMGIRKVRITGGEPFVRRDLVPFMRRISKIENLQTINLTTNGVLTDKYLADFQEIGIRSVNLSLDTLDRERFKQITRRDELPRVLRTLDGLQAADIHTKINAVVMDGKNTEDLIPLAMLSKDRPIDVRFIEEMPFNGEGAHYARLEWDFRKILNTLQNHFSGMKAVENEPHATARNYQIPGHQGKVGVIPAFSRTFCGSCNRIRLTAKGMLKTCLYDDGVLDIRALLRSGATDLEIEAALRKVFSQRPENGFIAERNRKKDQPVSESMSTIGG